MLFKPSTKKPDLYLPIYSDVGIVKNNDKSYAVMNLEGINAYEKKSLNVALGLAVGMLSYSAYSSSNYSSGFATAMALSNGLAVATLLQNSHIENNFSEQMISFEVDPNQSYFKMN